MFVVSLRHMNVWLISKRNTCEEVCLFRKSIQHVSRTFLSVFVYHLDQVPGTVPLCMVIVAYSCVGLYALLHAIVPSGFVGVLRKFFTHDQCVLQMFLVNKLLSPSNAVPVPIMLLCHFRIDSDVMVDVFHA